MDAVVRPGSMIGSSQFSSVLSRIKMDGDSDSERVVTSLVDGPAALLRYEEDEDDGDEEDDTEDEYEFQDDYIYDIASRLKEVNAQHFAEPLPTSKEHKVKFADNPVDRVLNYSPTPLMDVDERLQLKKEYLMKLFAKDDSERGDGQSDDSDLFSSSDDEDDDFIDKAKAPSPVVELPRSPSPNPVQDGYDSDDEAEQKNGVQITELRGDENQDELDNKIMELIERSVRSPDYHAGKEAAESLGSRIKNTIQESFKKDPNSTTVGGQSNGSTVQNSTADDASGIKTPSPEPPAVTLNESTIDMTKQTAPERQPPKDLAIRPRRSPPTSPKKSFTKSTPPSPRKANDRLSAPLNQAAFPPSPTRFIRKSAAQEASSAASQKRPRPPSSSNSSDTIVSHPADKDVKKLPSYTGNDRSRYGLPLEEKARLKEERDKVKREKEQKARQDEEAKLQRKLDAQKTFEAWLKNKESEKKGFPARKKALSPTPNDENSHDFVTSPNTTVTFLTWLEGKKIQDKQDKLQHRLRQIELEELERKHTRQDAQKAYKRWLRKKALETEQQRISEKQKKVEEKLSSSSLTSKEALDSFFQSEHFHSLEHHTMNGKL